MFGAGCAAYNATPNRAGAACSISGTGEQIMERLMSFSVTQQMRQSSAPTSHKRKASASRRRSKRRRHDPDSSASSVDGNSIDEAESEEKERNEEGDEEEDSSSDDEVSLEEMLRRALQDEQPEAFDTASTSREALSAGIIALQVSPALASASSSSKSSRSVDLLWAHSTPHFGVAYMAAGDVAPHSFISSITSCRDELGSPAASNSARPSVAVAGQRFRF
jgi:hypothetical protein